MRARTVIPTMVLAALLAAPALAVDIAKLPGYVDLDWIAIPDGATEVQDIVLDPVLAGLAAGGSDVDPALNQALAMVKSVRVKSFSLAGVDESSVAADVRKLQDRLAKGTWERLVYMKDGDETVTVSTLTHAGKMAGLMVLTYEPGDSATFINVVGDLDLTTLLRLATQLHGEQLHGMLSGMGADDEPHGDHRDAGTGNE
jgi:hypothetical protein